MAIIAIIMFLLILVLCFTIGDVAPHNREIHHDSRPGSFYEISNRKDN